MVLGIDVPIILTVQSVIYHLSIKLINLFFGEQFIFLPVLTDGHSC